MLDERFEGLTLNEKLHWLNPPFSWKLEPGSLIIEPDPQTDFWQKTHYGFEADNGHLLYCEMPGDFVLSTKVTFEPTHQYDQAGLMVRFDSGQWLKTSVEYEEEEPSRLGVVVTDRGYSDWSVQEFSRDQLWLRVTRKSDDFIVEFSEEGEQWSMLRLTHLESGGRPAMCGLYACSPKGGGFRAEFHYLTIKP